MKLIASISLIFVILPAFAQDKVSEVIYLKHVSSEDVQNIIHDMAKQSIAISGTGNKVIMTGPATYLAQYKNIIQQIDQPPEQLKLSFISSARPLAIDKNTRNYHIGKNLKQYTQTLSISEGLWATVTTGVSVPVISRTRNADGSESQSLHYKKVLEKYLFNIMEYDNHVSIKVKMDKSNISHGSDAIQHRNLATRLSGKVGSWIKVAGESKINSTDKKTYSTHSRPKDTVHLYIKIDK